MIRIRIPATTANLGPGFDCMGLALDLWNTFELKIKGSPIGEGPLVHVSGEGSEALEKDQDNLVVQIMKNELGPICPHDFSITCYNQVPCASGLGSSSTAVLAGLLFGEAVKNEERGQNPAEIDLDFVLRRAVQIEGHGDNVAPALLGGFVIVVPDGDRVLTQRIPHVPIQAVVCVPQFKFLTCEARASLPNSYSRSDAIFNIGRAMLVAEALRSGNNLLLAEAMKDKIHEPYRVNSIPGAEQARAAALHAGALCVALSGAGPGMIAFTKGKYDRIGEAMNEAFARSGLKSRYWILDATSEGIKVSRLPV